MRTPTELANNHPPDGEQSLRDSPLDFETALSVCWPAIFAGAVAAAALSLILLMLGTGLGLAAVSPWAANGVSANTFGVSAIVWIALTQLLASGMGGYLAGRLRTRWLSAHTDEVYFRDTAHGFLAWAVATLVTAAMLTSATGAIVNSGVQAGAAVANTAVASAASMATSASSATDKSGLSSSDAGSYFIDALFRPDTASTAAVTPSAVVGSEFSRALPLTEVTRIFVNAVRTGTLPADDLRYVGQVVAQRVSISQVDAEKRVTEAYNRLQTQLREAETTARAAADKARKASAYATLWLFISLLLGAFTASLAATWGSRQRDFSNQHTTNM